MSEQLERALVSISKSVEKLHRKGRVTDEERDSVLANVTTATEVVAAAEADFVIEAVVEALEVKLQVFVKLDECARPEVILASNTSSISITELGAVTRRPDRVIGMHFINLMPLMKPVEIIQGLGTSDETAATTSALAEILREISVEAQDYPGFISNRILCPMINGALYALME